MLLTQKLRQLRRSFCLLWCDTIIVVLRQETAKLFYYD